jgi:hypothetical protein
MNCVISLLPLYCLMAWMEKFLLVVLMSQDSSVGVVNKLYAGELRNYGLILVGDKRFFSSSHWLWGPPTPQFSGYWQFFLQGKATGAWSWPYSSSQCQTKEWGELYLHSPVCLYGVQRDNHILIISLLKLKEASVAVRIKVHDVSVGNAWPKVVAILMRIWKVV